MKFWRWGKRRQREAELERELRSHLELESEEQQAAGVSPEEAAYAARRALGNTTQIKEDVRTAWGFQWLETLLQDVRYGLRQLRRNPGFTIVAALTLALGIGANTAIFSLIDAVALKGLPVKNPEQLQVLTWTCGSNTLPLASNVGYKFRDSAGGQVCSSFSYPLFEQFQTQTDTFSSVFGYAPLGSGKPNLNVSVEGHVGTIAGEMVTGGYFSGLGVTPILGRPITAEDEKPNAPATAIISYRYWAGELNRNPGVIGKTIALNGMPFTIIGVMPSDFFGLDSESLTDVWVPAAPRLGLAPWGKPPTAGRSLFTSEDQYWLIVMGRLRPAVTSPQATARLNLLFGQRLAVLPKSSPKVESLPQVILLPARNGLAGLRQQLSVPLLMLGIMTGLVLLIACANVASLLLVRAVTRRREIGIRLAVGASRSRLVRQLLTESVLLAGIGGTMGLLFGIWILRVLLLMLSGNGEQVPHNVGLDPTVLGFTVAVALLTGILFGLAPSLRATELSVTPRLKETEDRIIGGGQRTLRLGNVMVIGQVAVSLVLLVAAGLLVSTLRNLKSQNLGFDTHNLLLFSVDPTALNYDRPHLLHLYDQLQQGLETLPGVRAATLSLLGLASGAVNTDQISIDGYKMDRGQTPEIFWNAVGPGFFETMEIPLLIGRGINSHDTEGSSKVAVVNESLARYFFGDANPIGRRIRIGANQQQNDTLEIVGIAKDVKDSDLHESPPRTIYIPYAQMPGPLGSIQFEIRTNISAAALVPSVRGLVRELDSHLPILDVKTEREQIDESVLQERLFAGLSSFAGAFALLLACIGLYGTVAHSVNRRTHEIGIRMALGAARRDATRLIISQGVALTLVGVAVGIAGALALTRFLSSLLYGVKPTDPLTFAAVSLILIAVALAGCYIPARRAAKVDPMVALRYE
ncbi:MAG TPA: ABC transporter permease [Terriglobia bacterium]|nr:ABC transporter permease [Terriglobia bacterium]